MTQIGVMGAGAFGTALAISLASRGGHITLWARDASAAQAMSETRENQSRLAGFAFPDSLTITSHLDDLATCDVILMAVPMQALASVGAEFSEVLSGKTLVACCKGIDLKTGRGPAEVIAEVVPTAIPAALSGPSFAVDIANGLPTALTVAARHEDAATRLQSSLSTANLRLYRSTDVVGVEIGGALKNVVAIACGITIGAGLGESARAALMTRGYAEMMRFAVARGAKPETLAGLSGFGDLTLTCLSEKSRNYVFGLRLGQRGQAEQTATTEGVATAQAVADIARAENLDMPVTSMMSSVLHGQSTVRQAIETLMARPLRSE